MSTMDLGRTIKFVVKIGFNIRVSTGLEVNLDGYIL